MTANELQDRLKQQPFRPFRLVLSSGKSYEIRHPEMALVMRTSIMVAARGIDDEGIWEEGRLCSLLHVTALEPIEGAPVDDGQG